jgi:peptidylprolyl isomerase
VNTHGVDIEADAPGSGELAERGKTVVVRLHGALRRGDVFIDGRVETFTLGRRTVIAGLEYGVEGMRVGGRRRIRVPPHLAYGNHGVPGTIPANALLLFDIELIEVRD